MKSGSCINIVNKALFIMKSGSCINIVNKALFITAFHLAQLTTGQLDPK